jgi:hypothetical protein
MQVLERQASYLPIQSVIHQMHIIVFNVKSKLHPLYIISMENITATEKVFRENIERRQQGCEGES